MTPPIFTPDGTEVEEVILPDGSEASEVIAPDGTVVFERDVIPDSVALYLFDEGSGSTFGDSDGDADGSFINGSWVSDSEAVGGFMAENSDSDRLGEVAVSDQPTIGDTGYVLSTFEFPDVSGHGSNDQFWTHNDTSGDNRLQFSTDTGDWFVGITDNSSIETGILSFEDNTKYRLGIAWDSGDYRIAHNGNIVRSGSYSGSLSLNEVAWAWGGRSGTDSGATETKHDNTRIGSVYPTEDEIEADYNDQPWS